MRVAKKLVWPLVAALVIAGASFGTVDLVRGPRAAVAAPLQAATATPEPRAEVVAPASDLAKAFRAVHNALKDAVVNINIEKPAPRGRTVFPPGLDDGPDVLDGTGSGVIVDALGHILTNNHVVDEASKIVVRLDDGREFPGKLVGADPKTDLAVIKITADRLTYAKFGDSDALEVGDWVLAFGSPLGFEQTMTHGIISQKGRHTPIIEAHNPLLRGMTYENFLQTDAPINRGNSGGPLVNLRGEVVGINSAIASNTGESNGIGFSIPSNDAKYVMESLIRNGKVVRGFLGINIEEIGRPVSKEHEDWVAQIRGKGFTGDRGVLVGQVNTGPATGVLQPRDVITAINGKVVATMDELRNQIARTAPESSIRLTIFRDGKTQDVTCKVGTQPDTNPEVALARARGRGTPPGGADTSDLGIEVQDLNATMAQRYKLDPGKGAIVTGVTAGSLADQMDLERGVVITKVNDTDITSAKQLVATLKSAKLSDGVKLTVRSSDGTDRLVYFEKK